MTEPTKTPDADTPATETPDTPVSAKPEPVYSEFIETVKLSPEEEAARKRRNVVIALGLVAFVVLIAVTTMVRMSTNYNTGA